VKGFQLHKKSIDARSRQVKVNLTLTAFINEPVQEYHLADIHFPSLSANAKRALIIGAGPAGLFSALELIQLGIKPIILERGKNVRERRRDLARLNKEGIINEDSNYCFGEGGAGTYSDGKLYTRSTKRGDINRVLEMFVHFGADKNILFESHPHIGTNKLPGIISAMREQIIAAGGEIHFEKKFTGFTRNNDSIVSALTQDGDQFNAEAFILATGHSARDIFYLLQKENILIESKAFALGVRAEHPQSLIDSIQYHCNRSIGRPDSLPAASYQLVEQISDKGVFSFCMCPGGIIATASTSNNELVVNGWSPSKRNNPFANSGIVVQIELKDAMTILKDRIWNDQQIIPDEKDPLLMMYLQQNVERKAFTAGGGSFIAPAQRLVDFSEGKMSSSLPDCSYIPGIHSSRLNAVLPNFVARRLQRGFLEFGKKMKGYYSNEAVVVATESRTSSPVRIPRDAETLLHPQFKNLYPCGEGAGYAGGIVSAAMDGQKVARAIKEKIAAKL
jgi:uncharacterized FAD-dependent dehydrogenase